MVPEPAAETAAKPELEPEPEPEPEGTDPYKPSTWDLEADGAAIGRAFGNVHGAYLEDGFEAGTAALAALTYSELTGDELFECKFPGRRYSELDADNIGIDLFWDRPVSDEGAELYGRIPSDDGWRVYLADPTVVTMWVDQGQTMEDSTTLRRHVAIGEAGHVRYFPDC